MSSASRPLTQQQRAVFAVVHHYHEALGEPAPASYVARKLAITKQRVQAYFQTLNELGWLRSSGSPAIPTRPLPAHGGLTNQQLPRGAESRHASNVAKRTVQPRKLGETQTVDLPPLSLRADVVPQSIDEETRTVELVFTTGAPVQRYDWWNDERYIETLSLEPEHVRIERLNTIGPLLNAHSSYEVSDQIGAVVAGSVKLTKNEGRCAVRFSKRPEVAPIWQDVRDGILRSVSVGYKAFKYEEAAPSKDNAMPIRKAIDWEPYEVSMVPIPADAGARVRGDKPGDTNPCQIVTRREQETRMDPVQTASETIAEVDPLKPPVERKTPPAEPSESDAAVALERTRTQGILAGCRAARLPQSYADTLIGGGVSLVESQTRILAELAKRGGDDRGAAPGPQDVRVGDDPLVHLRKGIEGALLHRLAPESFKLDDQAREYRGMGLLDIAEVFLRAQGVRITSMSKMERAAAALGMSTRAGGMHTISDFPLLLADVANKVLRAAYEAAPQTWAPLSKTVPLSDFKSSKQLQVGDAPQLLEVLEHGEFTSGTIAEAKEEIQLKTYGRIFAITRQALINDDTNAFAEVPALFGRSARTKESDLAWAQITSNPVMGDGVVLFHTATHRNLSATSDAIAVASIGAGRASLRNQLALDGVSLMNLSPNFLIVPAAKETIADQFVSNALMASEPGSINPFAGRLQVISEPRLDVNSVTAWYLATNPAQCPILLHGTLDGQGGPQVDQEIGFDVDGLKIKCRLDVAFKAADFRGIFKNPGA